MSSSWSVGGLCRTTGARRWQRLRVLPFVKSLLNRVRPTMWLFVDSQAVGVIEAKKAMRRDPSESGTAARVQDPHWTDWHRFLSSFGIDSPSRTDGMQFALVSKCAPSF